MRASLYVHRTVIALALLASCRHESSESAPRLERSSPPVVARASAPPLPALSPPRPAPPTSLRPHELFAHANWIGTEVTVDIFEPIRDENESSLARGTLLDVAVADVGAMRFGIETRKLKLEKPLRAPVRVTGALSQAAHGLRIDATSMMPLAFPPPQVTTDRAMIADPATWADHYVQVDGDWLTGFEASRIGQVWINVYPDVKIACEPKQPRTDTVHEATTHHVRVIGFAHTRGHYGHRGMAPAEIVATSVSFCP